MPLKGRLGLQSARVPQRDRHGVIWLARGNLVVQAGNLQFLTAGFEDLPSGSYAIPYQMLSCIVLQPGTTVSHDVLRLLARHGVGLVATGTSGVRFYASMPFGPDESARARRQARIWADEEKRIAIARRMYAWRLGEVFPATEIAVLRGLEGSRMKNTYKIVASQYGIEWKGRRYNRKDPASNDDVNQAINHASVAVTATAMIAVAVTGVIPQLGFIHEDSGYAFSLDIADLYRDEILLPIAFSSVRERRKNPSQDLEKLVRRRAGKFLREQKAVTKMIDRIKKLFDANSGPGDPERS